MTVPMQAAQPGQPVRLPNGYVQYQQGYDSAIQQATGQQPQQPQQQAQPFQLPPQLQQQMQPQPQNLPPQMQSQMPSDGGYPVSMLPPAPQQPGPQNMPQRGDFRQMQAAQPFMQPQPQGQPMQAPQGVDLGTRLIGQGIPPELQGRTVGEAIAIMNGLRQVHLQSLAQQPGQQPAAQPQSQQASAQQQPTTGWDWKNPHEAIGRVVDERLAPVVQKLEGMLAPVIQSNAVSGIQSARNTVAAEFGPLFPQIENLVLQRLNGIDPRALANPETWRIAADSVYGSLSRRGINVQQPQAQPQQQGPGMYPIQQPGTGQPLPNLNSFFSEQPNQGGPGAQGVQLTPTQRFAQQAMGIPEADYVAWLAGVRPNNGGVR